jgi:hypothetical protein
MKPFFYLLLLSLFFSCKGEPEPIFLLNPSDSLAINRAQHNGNLVNEGYERSRSYVNDWLEHVDPKTGLIPRNLSTSSDIWNAQDAAADNYPFMVLSSYLLDEPLYKGQMLDILNTEKSLTSRLGNLPDTYSFSKQDFINHPLDTLKVIFGASEYIKDGLIPITEYIGNSPWSERMLEMLNELSKYLQVAEYGNGNFFGNSLDTEINGEMLQTLSRMYFMTKDERYLSWATKIADYYLLENPDKILQNKRFRLRDHGCEIIGGLSEFYALIHFIDPETKAAYKAKIYQIFDRILEIGRNEDGMFYNEVNMITGEIVDDHIVDNWGYLYNAYYTIFLIDNHSVYREAVLKPLTILKDKYQNYNWENGSSDGFADAIESGINLYNREPVPALKEWLDKEIQFMWAIQDTKHKNSGIVEGWHGDGNFARTTIMYCLWKSQGLTMTPWRSDIKIGATNNDTNLLISIEVDKDWQGDLQFDTQRHKTIMHMPQDWPRINQFPEWFTPKDQINYQFIDLQEKKSVFFSGKQLSNGIRVSFKKGRHDFILRKEIHQK